MIMTITPAHAIAHRFAPGGLLVISDSFKVEYASAVSNGRLEKPIPRWKRQQRIDGSRGNCFQSKRRSPVNAGVTASRIKNFLYDGIQTLGAIVY